MEKKVIRKKKNTKKHIVVFQDHEGNVLNTVFVNDGDSVSPPPIAQVLEEGEHDRTVFRGWNQSLTSIHENIVVKPIYFVKPKEYLIMYFHENGKILGTETVLYGESATCPYLPFKEETEEFRYHFTGWNQDLSYIKKDCMVKACFEAERKRFLVRFFGDGEALLKEEMVEYGASATAPLLPQKESDLMFDYSFQQWNKEFSSIIEETDIHAEFRANYIDYTISFFEEGRLIESRDYHYMDKIRYPILNKKGYEFIWESHIEHADESKEIRGHWQFSNRKGKQIEDQTGLYEIIDPSVSSGRVRLILFYKNWETIKVPDRVKLGDYHYDVTNLGKNAFVQCYNTKKIICGNNIKVLEDKCFQVCRKVEEIILGKHVSIMKNRIFFRCEYLRTLRIDSKQLPKIYRNTFEGINRRVCINVPFASKAQYKRLLRDTIREKNMIF